MKSMSRPWIQTDLATDAARRLRGESCANCEHFSQAGECWKDAGHEMSQPPSVVAADWCLWWKRYAA
jgi:hypothetical protein